jgi:predicted transcriptional regulator
MNTCITDTKTKRRDKLSIIAEILQIAEEGTLKTQIMYKANLSFAQLNDYLKFLINANLLNRINDYGKDVYVLTEKGKDFLQRHSELVELITTHEKSKNTVKAPPQRLLRRN